MKKCFVCKQGLDMKSKEWPNWEDDDGFIHTDFIYNEDYSAHSACVWRAAKTMMTAVELINDN